jgi:outer membrane biosynthesis protein TonB
MEERESLREVESLRFSFQMNNRLRLECLAAVSKVFREFETPLTDELLGRIVFALPQELVSNNGNGHAQAQQLATNPPASSQKPIIPPEKPRKPAIPPEKPRKPAIPPEKPRKPAIPPEKPRKPAIPPEKPRKPAIPPEKPRKVY